MKRQSLLFSAMVSALIPSIWSPAAMAQNANSYLIPFWQESEIFESYSNSRYGFPMLPPPPRKIDWSGDANAHERAYNLYILPDYKQFTAPGVTGPQIPVSTDVTRVNKPSVYDDVPGGYLRVDPGAYALCTSSCYGLSDPQRRFVMFGLRGSVYSVESPTRLTLHKGRMLVISSKVPVTITTGSAKVVIATGATGIVETTADNTTRAFCLSSDNFGPVDMKKAGMTVSKLDNTSPIKLAAGQELAAGGSGLSDRALVTNDGIARRLLGAEAQQLPADMRKWEFSIAQLADYDVSLGCRRMEDAEDYPSRLLKQTYVQMLDFASKQDEFAAQLARHKTVQPVKTTTKQAKPTTTGQTQTQPISANPPATIEKVAHKTEKPEPANYKVLSQDKWHYVLTDNNSIWQTSKTKDSLPSYTLSHGKLLVFASKPLKVTAGDLETKISGGAMVLFRVNNNRVKVVNLGDLHRKSVYITGGGKTLRLAAGQELMVTENLPDVVDVYDIHKIGHRNVASRRLEKLGHVTVSEVSLGDTVVHEPLVLAFRKGASTPQEKKLVVRMVKTAASLSVVRSKGGLFQLGRPDDETGASRHMATRCNNCLR